MLFFTVILYSILSGGQSMSTLASRPWVTPCGASKKTNDHFFIFPSLVPKKAEAEKVYDISIKMKETRTQIQDLKNLYFSARSSKRQFYELKDQLDSNVFNLVGFPVMNLDIDSLLAEYLTDHIKEDYKTLSEVMVFLEQAIIAVDGYKDGILQPSTASLKRVNVQFLGILCSFQDILHNHNISVTDHVTRDVIPISAKSIESVEANQHRDFYILKGTLDVLNKLVIRYSILSSKLKENPI